MEAELQLLPCTQEILSKTKQVLSESDINPKLITIHTERQRFLLMDT